jgi:hypothetical protein
VQGEQPVPAPASSAFARPGLDNTADITGDAAAVERFRRLIGTLGTVVASG